MSVRRAGPLAAPTRLRRLLVMLPWLMERREVPVAEVAERFHMTPAEVAAELELVAMCGLPPFVDELIDVFIDDEMVYVGVPRVFTKPLRLTAPEGFALLAAGRGAMQLPGADPDSALGRGLAKLAAAVGEVAADDEVTDRSLVLDLSPTPRVDELVDAVRRIERVRMRYWTASRDEVTEREFTPRRVFHERGDWFVSGDDHRSGEYRTFRTDRIEELTPLGVFDDPVDDDAGHSGPATSIAWTADGSLPRVRLRVQPAARWVIEQYPADAVVEVGDGVVEATFAVLSERWLERLLLRAAPLVEVIEPERYRTLAADAARRLLARYR